MTKREAKKMALGIAKSHIRIAIRDFSASVEPYPGDTKQKERDCRKLIDALHELAWEFERRGAIG